MEIVWVVLGVILTGLIGAALTGGWVSPNPLIRDRDSDRNTWSALYPQGELPQIEQALVLIRDAFLLRVGDEWRLRPEDKLIDLYRAAYPPKASVDALEFTFLLRDVRRLSGLTSEELRAEWTEEMSVAQVVELCLRRRLGSTMADGPGH